MKTSFQHYRKIFALISAAALALLGIAVITKRICPNQIVAAMYPVKGIDVSHHQGTVDWKTIRGQGIDFAFIKATEGSGSTDENFSINWQQAQENGILIGAYHFFSFDSPGTSQADWYIHVVGSLSGSLRPVVDVEFYGDKEINPPPAEEVRKELTSYLQAMEKEYSVKPIIYTTYKVYERYLKDSFKTYPLWIRNVYFPPIDKSWKFWQYSDRGILDGVKGRERYIDLNVFRGKEGELANLITP